MLLFFFFQAEDGIRDDLVTGVQTCALPILPPSPPPPGASPSPPPRSPRAPLGRRPERRPPAAAEGPCCRAEDAVLPRRVPRRSPRGCAPRPRAGPPAQARKLAPARPRR